MLAGALPALSFWIPRARELLRGLDPRVDYLLSTAFVLSCYAAALPFGWRAAGLYARHGDRAELWSSWFPAGTGFLAGLAYFFAGAPTGSIWGAWLWSLLAGSAGICAGQCVGTFFLERRRSGAG